MDANVDKPNLTAKDFASDQEVRWCPGCGDYAILKAVRATLAAVGARTDNTVFISGIGCSSRFPYYMSTYGFHTIHGRAPAIATGAILANPDLDVWIITGDGDGLSIGGNHLMHILRRNVNCQILLFNNEVYGLTKGQYSPTSHVGTVSPSSPMGTVDNPIAPAQFALGAGATFVARTVDTQQKQLPEILRAAYEHKGTSFVEIFQNCIVYNDDVFSYFTERDVVQNAQIEVKHGAPLLFGEDGDRGLVCDPTQLNLQAVQVGGDDGVPQERITIHDKSNPTLAYLLARMWLPEHPVATGVLYESEAPIYEEAVYHQIDTAKADSQRNSIAQVLRSGMTWEVT